MLVCAIFAVATGIAILGQPEAFSQMFLYYREKPVMLVVFILSIIPATVFIFKGFSKASKDKK